MSGEHSHAIYAPPRDYLRERLDNLAQLQLKERAAERRRRCAVRMSAVIMAISIGATGFLVVKHEQRINHDTIEITALAKAQGYIDAKAYKPTIDKGTSK